MIRAMRASDIDAVADIWLNTNISAHSFVPARYWKDNFEMVKGMLSEAELYVYEDGRGIQGFVGLEGDYIAGIFVRSGAQSRGIGGQLLDFVKSARGRLTLNVYQKNSRAVKFYRRAGFELQREQIDENTGETEYQMLWKR